MTAAGLSLRSGHPAKDRAPCGTLPAALRAFDGLRG